MSARRLTLTENASLRGAWAIAAVIVVTAIAATAALWPVLSTVLGPRPGFLVVYAFIIAGSEVGASLLLAVRAHVLGSRRAALLAAAYAFSAPLVVTNVATLPGVVVARGAFGHQTPPWAWLLWHTGWAVFILAYALMPERKERRSNLIVVGALAASVLAILAALGADWLLPRLLEPPRDTYTSTLSAGGWAAAGLLTFAALALSRRRLLALDAWVVVALVALALDMALVLGTTARFSVGSYIARALGALNAITVLLAVAVEYGVLVRRDADATALKLALDEATTAEAAFRSLADAVPNLVWTANADGWIDWYNQRWYAYTGQTPAEAQGWGWRAVHHPDDLAEVMRRWPASIATGEPFEMEFRLRDAGGRYRWFLTRIVPQRDALGNIVKWYGTNTDVDEARRASDTQHRLTERLQSTFLPDALPTVEGIGLTSFYRPAAVEDQVGGDWYDAFAAHDALVLSVGDVAGHGVDAAMTMLRFREAIRAVAVADDRAPHEVLRIANRAAGGSGAVATALVARVEPQAGRLSYASAGHPPAILVRAGTVQQLELGGPPLGADDRGAYATLSIDVKDGDVLVLYTDGLIETRRDPDEGIRRLEAVLARGVPDPETLVNELAGTASADDVALLIVRFGA